MDFESIDTFEIVGLRNSVTYNTCGEDNSNGSDVFLSINGDKHIVWYTNKTCRNKLKQIEKYFSTKNPKLEAKCRENVEWLKVNGYGVELV